MLHPIAEWKFRLRQWLTVLHRRSCSFAPASAGRHSNRRSTSESRGDNASSGYRHAGHGNQSCDFRRKPRQALPCDAARRGQVIESGSGCVIRQHRSFCVAGRRSYPTKVDKGALPALRFRPLPLRPRLCATAGRRRPRRGRQGRREEILRKIRDQGL